MATLFGLEKSGDRDALVERIVQYLNKPYESAKTAAAPKVTPIFLKEKDGYYVSNPQRYWFFIRNVAPVRNGLLVLLWIQMTFHYHHCLRYDWTRVIPPQQKRKSSGGPAKKAKKAKKDGPKRTLSSYMLFANDSRAKIKESHPGMNIFFFL